MRVNGIDASPAMVEKLRSKPGGAAVPVALGDFGSVTSDGPFALAFVAFNTFLWVVDARRSGPVRPQRRGDAPSRWAFVIEAFVPDVGRFDRGQRLAVSRIEPDAGCGPHPRRRRHIVLAIDRLRCQRLPQAP